MKLFLKTFLITVLVPIILLDCFLFLRITTLAVKGGWSRVRGEISSIMFDEEEYHRTQGDDRLRYVAKTVAEGYERSVLFIVALILIHFVIMKGLRNSGRNATRNISRIGAASSESNESKLLRSGESPPQ